HRRRNRGSSAASVVAPRTDRVRSSSSPFFRAVATLSAARAPGSTGRMPRTPESLSYARQRAASDPQMQELEGIINLLHNDFPALAAQVATIWVPIQIG